MWSKRQSLLALATVVVIGCGAALYYHQTYFFNPLTFQNNNVVYLPFRWYKNPMQMQVWGTETPSSASVIYTTFDKTQIRFVLKELESGQVVDNSKFKSADSTFAHITIRSGSRPDSPIVQDAFMTGQNFDVAQIYTQVPGRAFPEYITLSPTLKKWVLSALEKGKPIH